MDHEPLMTVDALAEYLGVPKRSVYSWLRDGTAPPSFKVGKYRRFRRADIDAWLDDRRDTPTA